MSQLILRRLANQHLSDRPYATPADVVRSLGGVQSQDHPGAKWALGLRGTFVEKDVDEAFNDGLILRTHVLRPTWHYVVPEDIRWMLALTAPRIQTGLGSYYRKLNMDETFLRRAAEAVAGELQGGTQYDRAQMRDCFDRHKIPLTDPLSFGFIAGWAELEGYLCSGAMRGKQHTYALLADRAPHAKTMEHDEAVAELTRRYFTSHGPATSKDFGWWSSLTVSDVSLGLELNKQHLVCEEIDGEMYWFAPNAMPTALPSPAAMLLPNYDEYTVVYKMRDAYFDKKYLPLLDSRANPIFQHTLLIDGCVRGTWRRTITKTKVTAQIKPFDPLSSTEKHAVERAAAAYGMFLGLQSEATFV